MATRSSDAQTEVETKFYNLDAEQAVLGSALIDPEAAAQLPLLLMTTDYWLESHQLIHDTIVALVARRVPVDIILLADELEKNGSLDKLRGGMAYILHIINNTPTALYIDHYANIVKQQAYLRRALKIFSDIVVSMHETPNPNTVYAEVQSKLNGLTPPQDTNTDVLQWGESHMEYMGIQEEIARGESSDARFLWPWESWNQRILPLQEGMLAQIAGGTGIGKCMARGTNLVMFDGTLKAIEDVSVGDLLMGPDSTPRRVLGLGGGYGPLYTVHQNKGIDYTVNGEHILALDQRNSNGSHHYVEMTVNELRSQSPNYVSVRWQGYKVAIEFPEQPLPVDPYFMGVWLGCGEASACIVTDKQEIVSAVQEYAKSLGGDSTVVPEAPGIDRMLVRVHSTDPKFQPSILLRNLGVLNEPSLPHVYVANSTENRLQLLAGIIDGLGRYHANMKGYEINFKEKQLADDICYLANTLGFRSNTKPIWSRAKHGSELISSWKVAIWGDCHRIPLRVARKQAEIRKPRVDWRRTGITVEESGKGDYFGFVLDKDGLYLLEDMTVTHNTVLIEALADGWAENGLKVAIFHYELNRKTMLHRRYARWCRLRMDRLISPYKEPWEEELISSAGNRHETWPGEVHLVSMAGRHIDDTTAEMKRMVHELGIDVVIIDHAKKLHRHASPRQVAERLSELSRQADNFEALKSTSDVLDLRTVVVNHFNKDGKAAGAAATGNDIAGAGDQSDFVNLIVLLSRQPARKVEFDYYDERRGVKTPVTAPGQPSRWIRANIDKNTLGPEEKFWQWMDPEFFTIYDRPYDEDEMDDDGNGAMPMY